MNIPAFLAHNGPCLSSQIKERLLEEGLSEEAARKVISRTANDVCRADRFNFPKREKFLFLREQYRTPAFYAAMLEAFKTTSSVHYGLISAMHCLGGNVSEEKIKVIAACPISHNKKKSLETILAELDVVGYISKDGSRWELTENIALSELAIEDHTIIEFIGELLLENLVIWLKKNGFASYESIKRNSEFAGYYWDITGPSYLRPFITKNSSGIKPGFVVADIIPQYDISSSQIDYFIKKVESCCFNNKNRPFIPILIGNSFDKESFRKAKGKNILVTTPANFFGGDTDILLKNILRVLRSSSNINAQNSTENIKPILDAIAKIEGENNNLRGHFFELVAGNIVQASAPNTVLIGKKIKTVDGRKAEIDVFAATNSKINVYECKAYPKKRLITKADIEIWKNKVSVVYDWIKENQENSNKSVEFSYWTTSKFDEEASIEITKTQELLRRYSISKKDYAEVINQAKEQNMTSMVQLLKEHY